MSDRYVQAYRYGATKQQIQRAASDRERHVRQAWIDRVLDILDSENLITKAAAGLASADGLLFDCNVAPLVWDDPRVVYRRRQLESGDIAVELVDHVSKIAGKTFKRTQIKVISST